MVLKKLYQAGALGGGLPADAQLDSRTRMDKVGYVFGWNLSPFAFEIQDEGANPMGIAMPFAPYIHPLFLRVEKVIFHAVAQQTINLPIAVGQYVVYWEISEHKPELIPGPW